MAEFYISTEGNDSTGAGTYANPWKTFYRAFQGATDGDTVFLIGHASAVFDITSGGAFPLGINQSVYWDNAVLQKGLRFVAHSEHPTPIVSGMGNTTNYPIWSTRGGRLLYAEGLHFTNIRQNGSFPAFGQMPYNLGGTHQFVRCKFSDIRSSSTTYYSAIFGAEPGSDFMARMIIDACELYDCGLSEAHVLGVAYGTLPQFDVTNSIFVLELSGSYQFRGFLGAFGSWPAHHRLINNVIFNVSAGTVFSATQGAPIWAGSHHNCVHGFTHNTTDGGPNYDFGLASSTADPLFWDYVNRDFRFRAKDGSGNPNLVIEGGVML